MISLNLTDPVLVFWWYIPIIIGGLIAGSGFIASFFPEKTEGKTLGVLGMKGAGKSQFLSNLGLFEFEDRATNISDYNAHTLTFGDRTVEIQQGQDVGGDVDIAEFYNEWVGIKDITVFIFDGGRFINNKEYQSDVKARLFAIDKIARKKFGEGSDFKNIVVIVSHADLYKQGKEEDRKELLEKVANIIQDKSYFALLKKNCYAADLRNESEVKAIAEKIF